MEHTTLNNIPFYKRIGFHYFDDTLHYTASDLNRWLPILKKLEANWLVLRSSISRAIPEPFIKGFKSEGFNIIIDFDLKAGDKISFSEIIPLLQVYGKWGVGYSVFCKHANLKESWAVADWVDPDIASKHVQKFLETAALSIDHGIVPIFGPLFPGGSYPDLAFFEQSMIEISEQASTSIMNELCFGVYAWDFHKNLDWGAGGRAKWPKSSLLHPVDKDQSHLGFRSYEWYAEIIYRNFSKFLPVILYEAGNPGMVFQSMDQQHDAYSFNKLDAIFRLLKQENVYDSESNDSLLKHIPDYVLSGNFHVLSSANPENAPYCWFSEKGEAMLPAQSYFLRNSKDVDPYPGLSKPDDTSNHYKEFEINRYVLISENLKSIASQIIEDLEPYLNKYQPEIGYDFGHATKSAVILYVSSDIDTLESDLEALRKKGSLVKHISPNEISQFCQEGSGVY